MANKFEKPVPPGTGEEIFRSREADARAGLPERAAEAQKKAAKKSAERGKVDLTEDLKNSFRAGNEGELQQIAKEIEGLPDAFEESTDEEK